MSEPTLRVIVLGSAGDAQQQLRFALDELGAQTLAVGDFDQLDPAKMRELDPDVWLVSIDENTDQSKLDPWQPLFDNPDDKVIFDDADVTRRLSGWDLARWARHLAAKVLGRDDVLLPPVNPAAQRLPRAGEEPAAESANASPVAANGADAIASLELSPMEDPAPPSPAANASNAASSDTVGLSLVEDADLAALNASFQAARDATAGREAEPVASSLDDLLRMQSASVSAGISVAEVNPGDDGVGIAVAAVANAGNVAAKSVPAFDLGGLSLAPMSEDAGESRPAGKARTNDMGLGGRLGGLSLTPMEKPAAETETADTKVSVKTQELPVVRPAEGIIAVVAGLGGPDAVRQFLGALPSDTSVPVLLWQHLDAGKHDRLAQQLEKATKLPVYLARAGEPVRAGEVGVVSNGLRVVNEDGWRFATGNGGASQGLADAFADRTMVLVVLSGAEAAIVEAAKTHNVRGGKVLVQAPTTCFDATAASALDGSGATVAMPAELAQYAMLRWS